MILSLFGSDYGFASKISGKVTLGGYISQESFNEDPEKEELLTNDMAITSGRFILDITEISNKKLEFLTEVRDKFDYFGKLDKERQALSGDNTLQLRKLVLQTPESEKIQWKLGRFPAFDQGVAFVDGAEVGYQVSRKFSLGVFGGLNPKEELRDDLTFNQDSVIAGAVTHYNNHGGRGRYFNVTSAVIHSQDPTVSNAKNIEISYERSYLFNQAIIHFSQNIFLFSRIFFDVAPQADLQNLWLSYNHDVSKRFDLELAYLNIKSAEYQKVQDIREELEASNYNQASGTFTYKFSKNLKQSVFLNLAFGSRSLDAKSKQDIGVGFRNGAFISSQNSLSLLLGMRKNFVSDDLYTKISFNHYRKVWGLDLDLQYISEKREDGETLNPIYFDAGISYITSRKLFFVFGGQYVTDNRASIVSALIKMTYRFGSQKLPPIRDGAPPKGRL